MATFGTVIVPNKLFDLADADRDILRNRAIRQDVQRVDDVRALEPEIAAGGTRREAALDRMLAIDPTRGAQVQNAIGQREQRAQQASEAEMERLGQMSRALLTIPAGPERQAAYRAMRTYQQGRGMFRDAPDEVPDEGRLRGFSEFGKTPAERALETRERQEAAERARTGSLFNYGGAPAAAGPSAAPAPIGGGDIRAQNSAADAMRREAYATLQGPDLDARLAEISAGRAYAANGTPPGTPHRANPGKYGQYEGIPAPSGAVPVIGDRRADAGPVMGGVASRYPGAADVAGDGVIPESVTQAVLGPQPPRRGTLGPNAARAEAFIAGNAPEPGLGGYAPDGTDELAQSYAQAVPAPQPAPAAPVQADPPGVDTNVAEGMLARMSGAPAPVAVPEVAVTAAAPVPPPPAAPPGPPQAPRPTARPVRTNALLGVGSDGSADRLNEISLNLARGNLLADSPEARNIDRAMGTNRFAGAAAPEAMPAMGSITRENLPDVRPAPRPGTRQNALLPPAQAVVPFAQSQVAQQPSEPSPRQETPREITPAADGRAEIPVATPPAAGAAAPVRDESRLHPALRGLTPTQQATLEEMSRTRGTTAAEILREATRMQDANRIIQRQEVTERRSETREDETRRLNAAREGRAEEDARLRREAADRAAKAAEDKARRESGPEGATEAERKAAGFMERMRGAEEMLEGMVREGYDPSNPRDRYLGQLPVAGNYLTSPQGQRYLNAAAEWARAKLRLESGAAIGENEAREEAKTYFPMPGDDAATIEQKRRLRETAVAGIRTQAGRAVPRGNDATAMPERAGGGLPRVTDDASYDALPSGTQFIDPDGKTRRKP